MKCEAEFNECKNEAKYELVNSISFLPSLFVCWKHKKEYTEDNELVTVKRIK